MSSPKITIPAFVNTLKEFNIDCTYEITSDNSHYKKEDYPHRGQWADYRADVDFYLTVNNTKLKLGITSSGGGPMAESYLWFNDNRLAMAEEWYVGYRLKFYDNVLEKFVNELKKANKKSKK